MNNFRICYKLEKTIANIFLTNRDKKTMNRFLKQNRFTKPNYTNFKIITIDSRPRKNPILHRRQLLRDFAIKYHHSDLGAIFKKTPNS